MFTGTGTALVTPFGRDGSLDEPTLRSLIKRQIDAGIDFLVPCGTTGESPTLTHEEHLRVVEVAVELAKGRVPVLAGAGGYNTAEVIELARELSEVGADGILSVTPYYNKPTQEGLFQPQMAAILNAVPDDFIVLSGDDAITLPIISLGGRGVISVVSNEIPADMARLTRLALDGDFQAARQIHRRVHSLMEVNFVESNPIPVKAAMAQMGLLEAVWRLPLVAPKAENEARIHAVLESLELVETATLPRERVHAAAAS